MPETITDAEITEALDHTAQQYSRLLSAADAAGKLATFINAARLISAPCGAAENLLHRTIADGNDAAAQLIGVDVPAPE